MRRSTFSVVPDNPHSYDENEVVTHETEVSHSNPDSGQCLGRFANHTHTHIYIYIYIYIII